MAGKIGQFDGGGVEALDMKRRLLSELKGSVARAFPQCLTLVTEIDEDLVRLNHILLARTRERLVGGK